MRRNRATSAPIASGSMAIGITLTPVGAASQPGSAPTVTGPFVAPLLATESGTCSWLVYMLGVVDGASVDFAATWDGQEANPNDVAFLVDAEEATRTVCAQVATSISGNTTGIQFFASVDGVEYGPAEGGPYACQV